jgi:RNA polymerase sigma-70 factor (ECF subfamily)
MLSEQDQERFLRLWGACQPAVAGYIASVVRDSAAAKDVLQETSLVLFRKFTDYDEQRPFLGWALGVAKFQVLGYRRDASRDLLRFDQALLDQFTDSWAKSAPGSYDSAGMLETCLGRLESRARQLVRWRYFDDLTAEEIARRTATTGAAVRVFLQRIRAQLRACIEKQIQLERSDA